MHSYINTTLHYECKLLLLVTATQSQAMAVGIMQYKQCVVRSDVMYHPDLLFIVFTVKYISVLIICTHFLLN